MEGLLGRRLYFKFCNSLLISLEEKNYLRKGDFDLNYCTTLHLPSASLWGFCCSVFALLLKQIDGIPVVPSDATMEDSAYPSEKEEP